MTAREATSRPADRRERVTIVVFASLVILAFLGLGWRCYYLQYAAADHYAGLGLGQQFCSYLPLEPQRGPILDSRGRVLAASNQIRTVFAEPRSLADVKETSSELAPVLDMGPHEICKAILDSGNLGYAPIKIGATAAESDAARMIHGIGVQYAWQRYYPTGPLASHVVGFTSTDNQGLGGIEHQFDRELRGKGAEHTFFVDVHRRPLAFCVANASGDTGMPTNGVGIILTLDATIQQFAREALLEQFKAFEAEGAVGLVADPRTGAILAMVSLPDFDPADARHTDPNRFYNRALTDQYEPGSIIKPITAAIALDGGAITRDQTIFCENGRYRGKYQGKSFGTIHEFREGFGDLTIRDILAKSSNIGMAKIGQFAGPELLYQGLTLFGFGKKVGIELPGEAQGRVRTPDEWNAYSVTRVPFGQEVSVTALQLLRAFCMLANGGRLTRPYLIKAIVAPDGSIVNVRPPALRVGYAIKPEIANWIIREAMTAVVNEGTGRRAQLEKWQVFGKTGTAQLARPEGGGYEDHAYVVSFVGGAPADDPRIIVLVSIRKPNYAVLRGLTGGGAVAAPVARVIIEKTLTYLEATENLRGPIEPPRSASERGLMASGPR
ncbi:MAG: penicillin-binding protein 2 [Sedimentisphaerales bacterium]|nr:penicillin-binding protein 2 [Sedimentisphaerales bacterium]